MACELFFGSHEAFVTSAKAIAVSLLVFGSKFHVFKDRKRSLYRKR